MTTSFVVAADGLWRFLAPSIRRISPTTRARLLRPRASVGARPKCAIVSQLRSSSTSTAEAQPAPPDEHDAFGPTTGTSVDPPDIEKATENTKTDDGKQATATTAHGGDGVEYDAFGPITPEDRQGKNIRQKRDNTNMGQMRFPVRSPVNNVPSTDRSDPGDESDPLDMGKRHFEALSEHSVEQVYALLHRVAYPPIREQDVVRTWQRVQELVHHLVRYRREQPNLKLYAALMIINVNPEDGSAAAAARLLKEMMDEGLEPNSEICHNCLKVLAVHPDYLLRNAVLDYMRDKWFDVSDEGEEDIIAGVLRERQFEIAVDALEKMAQNSRRLPQALWTKTLFMLVDIGQIDEAMRVINFPAIYGFDQEHLNLNFWHHLLDIASSRYHLPATAFVWNRHVVPSYLNPPSGICYNVLATAARHGDSNLATDVFRVLTRRREVLSQQNYEALVDSYATNSDPEAAVSVITIMATHGTVPTTATTRSLLHWAVSQDTPDRAMDLFLIIKAKQDAGSTVPTVLMDVVIEIAFRYRNVEQAIEFYKALHVVCAAGPTTTTFNMMLKGVMLRKDLAMFLVQEMVELGVAPDELTYDRIIICCLRSERDLKSDFEDAWGYYSEMRSKGWKPRRGTLEMLWDAKQRLRNDLEREGQGIGAGVEGGSGSGSGSEGGSGDGGDGGREEVQGISSELESDSEMDGGREGDVDSESERSGSGEEEVQVTA